MTSPIKIAATEISKSRLTSMWPLMHNAVNARKTKACSFLKLFTASLLHHVPRLHILPWSRFSLLKPDLETTDQGPLRSDQTEIFRSLYAIRQNGTRLDITPTVGFAKRHFLPSSSPPARPLEPGMRMLCGLRNSPKMPIAQQRKKAASHKRSSIKGQYFPLISGDR